MTCGPLLLAVAVRQLHNPRHFDGNGYGWTICAECRQSWPCATEQAVAQALAVSDAIRPSRQRGDECKARSRRRLWGWRLSCCPTGLYRLALPPLAAYRAERSDHLPQWWSPLRCCAAVDAGNFEAVSLGFVNAVSRPSSRGDADVISAEAGECGYDGRDETRECSVACRRGTAHIMGGPLRVSAHASALIVAYTARRYGDSHGQG